jgi:hypothetical protein
MTVFKTVRTLTREAVSTAYGAARHPISSAAWSVGLVRGAAGVGRDLVRAARADQPEVTPAASPDSSTATEPETEPDASASTATETPSSHVPPPRKPVDVPEIDELPELIVIEADDPPGESFHTEPKPASRTSGHGGSGQERAEADDEAELTVTPSDLDIDIETPVGTTGAGVAHNPSTAESDLQQPGTEPLLDPGTAKAVRTEAKRARRAADPDKG